MSSPALPAPRTRRDPAASRGRPVPEPISPTRTEFQRDRDRIVHSTVFRRLAHKTQVFVYHEGDHFRTRLTHTIEVAQIARALPRALGLDDDLAEAVALGHDLGHTPFGHTGEEALDACMREHGGFEHNSHGLRLVTELERRYADFDGLNLCQETIEGLVKHNGPLLCPTARPPSAGTSAAFPAAILAYDRRQALELRPSPASRRRPRRSPTTSPTTRTTSTTACAPACSRSTKSARVPFIGGAAGARSRRRIRNSSSPRLVHELTRRVITRFIEDAIGESRELIAEAGSGARPRRARPGGRWSRFSPAMETADATSKRSVRAHVPAPEVDRVRDEGGRIVRALFRAYTSTTPDAMPPEWAARAARVGAPRARRPTISRA